MLWETQLINFSDMHTPGFFVVGDVNNDYFPDIIASREEAVVVMFGDGSGHFKEKGWACYEEVGGTPLEGFSALSGVLADLDKNGYLDLVISVVRGNSPRLYLFCNFGDGKFLKIWSRRLPFQAHYVWIADFNGDGSEDLILATMVEGKTEVFVLPAKPLSWMQYAEPALVATEEGKPFLLADFNGDNIPDLGFMSKERVKVLLGDGHGFFSTVLSFAPDGAAVEGCVAGDLNGDGLLDLVVLVPDGIAVAIQDRMGFAESAHYDLTMKAGAAHLCDLDGDGVVDLLLEDIYGQRLAVFPGDGKGGFLGVASEFGLVPFFKVHPVDLNCDGRADLLVHMGYFLSVLMNGGNLRGETRLPTSSGQLVTVGDLDGNMGLDLICICASTSGIEVFWNNAHGAFVRRPLITEFPKPGPGAKLKKIGERELEIIAENGREFQLMNLFPVAATVVDQTMYVLLFRVEAENGVRNARTVAELRAFTADGEELMALRLDEPVVPLLYSGDFDGNGKEDVAVLKTREIIILWDGKELKSYPWDKGDLAFFCVGDFGGTGKDSLALISASDYAGMYIVSFVERKMETTGPVFQLPEGAAPVALAAGDLDNDGLPDPVVIAVTISVKREGEEIGLSISGALLVMALSRHGVKTHEISGFPRDDAPWPFNGLTVGDFTGDGIKDVAYSTIGGRGVAILPGNGDGSFQPEILVLAEVGPLFSADLDGNGRLELLGSTLGLNPTIWILWNGGGK